MNFTDLYCSQANGDTLLTLTLGISWAVCAFLIVTILVLFVYYHMKLRVERSCARDARDELDNYERQMDLLLTYMAYQKAKDDPTDSVDLPLVRCGQSISSTSSAYRELCANPSVQELKQECMDDILQFYKLVPQLRPPPPHGAHELHDHDQKESTIDHVQAIKKNHNAVPCKKVCNKKTALCCEEDNTVDRHRKKQQEFSAYLDNISRKSSSKSECSELFIDPKRASSKNRPKNKKAEKKTRTAAGFHEITSDSSPNLTEFIEVHVVPKF